MTKAELKVRVDNAKAQVQKLIMESGYSNGLELSPLMTLTIAIGEYLTQPDVKEKQ